MIARLAGPTLAALALLLSGCSQSATVDEKSLEDELSSQLEAAAGQAPDDVDCPGDLDGEEGTEMRCTLTAGEDQLGVTVTVTEVDGEDVDFEYQVDEQ